MNPVAIRVTVADDGTVTIEPAYRGSKGRPVRATRERVKGSDVYDAMEKFHAAQAAKRLPLL